ncbi:nucleoside recognition domain-containing protein [Rubrivirga sp. IMCC43871]|uniref:nucleoside recognition domain-containing protein n=1 Tax=Rubrivirga sp. IMCC43871 TaxID=3391575 RepID=UPI00399022D1
MLNYIWAGLIIVSLVFALAADTSDIVGDTYRNGEPLPVELRFDRPFDAEAARQPVTVVLDSTAFRAFYGAEGTPEAGYPATFRTTADGTPEIRLDDADAPLPAPLDVIRDATNPRDQILQGTLANVRIQQSGTGATATAGLVFAPVRFVKLNAITTAAVDFAEIAITIAIGLIGVLVLFLGLSRIAEDAGIIYGLVKLVRPVLGPLFPDIPKDHPAMGMIALNLAANVFGLGNAATPFGIKAMEELQTLNPDPETATDSMAMLLAMNTASVQLIPPITLIAILGVETNNVYFPILFTTIGSLIVAITSAKLLSKLPRFRASNPLTNPAPAAEPEA